MFPPHRYPTLVCEASSYTRSTQQHIHLLPSSSPAIDYCIQTLVLPLIAPRPDLLVALSACFPYNTSLIGTYLLQFAPSKPTYRLSSLDAYQSLSLTVTPQPFIRHHLVLLIRAKPVVEPSLSFTSNSLNWFHRDAFAPTYEDVRRPRPPSLPKSVPRSVPTQKQDIPLHGESCMVRLALTPTRHPL